MASSLDADLATIWDDSQKVTSAVGGSFFHGISNRPTFAVIEAVAPGQVRWSSLYTPIPTIRNGHPLPIGAGGMNKETYLAVGVVRLSELGYQHRIHQDFLGVTRLDHTPTPAAKRARATRMFYALVVENGLLRPYEVSADIIYFFHEFSIADDPDVLRMTQWLVKVSEAIGKHLGAGAEGEQKQSGVDDKILSDITPARLAHMQQTISTLKEGNSSTAFRMPVDHIALGLSSYPHIIKQPMDLGTMEENIKNNCYTTVDQYVRDFKLIVNNCYTFNGWGHAVSRFAGKMDTEFDKYMKHLPATNAVEPPRTEMGRTRSGYQNAGPIEVIKVEDDDEEATVAASRTLVQEEAQLPALNRRRKKPGNNSEYKMEAIDKKLEVLTKARTRRSNEMRALLNDIATPQTGKNMQEMYYYTIGSEEVRAKVAFGHVLQPVTAALAAAEREETAMLKEIADAVNELREVK